MLTCAYSVKNGFLHEDSILGSIDKIREHPLAGGRGPGRRGPDLPAAHRVRPAQGLAGAGTVLVAGGGHAQYDPDVQHELLEATDRMHGRLADAGPAPTAEARRRTPVHAHSTRRPIATTTGRR